MTTADTLLPFIVLCSDPRWGTLRGRAAPTRRAGRETCPGCACAECALDEEWLNTDRTKVAQRRIRWTKLRRTTSTSPGG